MLLLVFGAEGLSASCGLGGDADAVEVIAKRTERVVLLWRARVIGVIGVFSFRCS
jgi:hypothetical protein